MVFLELRNHQVWDSLNEILNNIDTSILVKEHLELSDYKIDGYWDDQDEYYEEIILPRTLETRLISSSVGIANNKRFLQMRFSLSTYNEKTSTSDTFGELLLIYNEDLEFIDENWYLDIRSPFIEVKRAEVNY